MIYSKSMRQCQQNVHRLEAFVVIRSLFNPFSKRWSVTNYFLWLRIKTDQHFGTSYCMTLTYINTSCLTFSSFTSRKRRKRKRKDEKVYVPSEKIIQSHNGILSLEIYFKIVCWPLRFNFWDIFIYLARVCLKKLLNVVWPKKIPVL